MILGPKMFSRYSQLTHLSIYGFSIVSVEENIFRHLRFLTSLSFRSTYISEVPKGFIPDRSSIVSLDLFENKLPSIPYHLFENLPNLSSFNLSFNDIVLDNCSSIGSSFKKLPFLSQLSIANITVKNECKKNVSRNFFQPIHDTVRELNLTMSNVYEGDPRIFKDFTVLESLDISIAEGFKRCPASASALFSNLPDSLKSLVFRRWRTEKAMNSRCYINSTTLAGLKNLTRLSSIDMKYDDLIFGDVLHKSVFDGFARLSYLNLAWCRFSSVEDFAFDGCPRLKSLSLGGNPLGSRPIHLFSNKAASRLERLKLTGANIYSDYSKNYYPSDLLSAAPLKILDLSRNYLVKMPVFVTPNHTKHSLEVLKLNHNFLMNLYKKTWDVHFGDQCKYLPKLTNLSLSHNNIRKVIGLSKCKTIRFLDLSRNDLSVHWKGINEKEISDLEALEVLDLSFNELKKISGYTFARMSALKVVRLVGNNLTSIKVDYFKNNLQLEVLDLQANRLQGFSVSVVRNLTNLTDIFLQDNDINSIESELLKHFDSANSSVKTFGLLRNPLMCTCSQFFLQDWIKSSRNIIPEANRLECYGPTKKLENKLVYNYKRDNFACDHEEAVKAAAYTIGGIIVALLVGLPCYKYRWYVSHARVVIRAILNQISAVRVEHNCQYDAYVMYNSESEEDQQWVVSNFRSAIENTVSSHHYNYLPQKLFYFLKSVIVSVESELF